MKDLFEDGYVDMAIFQPTYLTDFYHKGFNTTEQDARPQGQVPGQVRPQRLLGAADGRGGPGRSSRRRSAGTALKGVKLYTAEWHGTSKGWKLTDPWALRYLEKAQELGVTNIHVHKGPTIWPLNRDSFDVADVDDAASTFPELNFIVEHVGLPRLEDMCWIGTQEPNVYGGLAVAMPFIHTRPAYFGQIVGELLYWLGEDRLLFASDYALWHPKWLVEKFVDYQYPMRERVPGAHRQHQEEDPRAERGQAVRPRGPRGRRAADGRPGRHREAGLPVEASIAGTA